MIKTKACLWLSPADRSALEEWVSGRNTPQKLVWRARIILLSADRTGVMAITRAVGMSKVTVARWQERYLAKGIAGLRRDASRPGRLKPLSADTIERVVHKTLHEKPPKGRWSIRKMAKASGLSYSSVQRIWKAHELKPHRVKTFKLSNDKRFVEKVQDVVYTRSLAPMSVAGSSQTAGASGAVFRHLISSTQPAATLLPKPSSA